jgi:hypothetical protein
MLNPQIALQKNIPWIKNKKRMGDSPDETAFIKRQMRKLLSDAEFVDIQITPFDWLHPNTQLKFIHLFEKFCFCAERLSVLKEFAGSLHISARRLF